ncbi:MAG: hypothetical protein PVG89_04055 [Gammaproteobacteria bacterium]|jgi:hypothetical protein
MGKPTKAELEAAFQEAKRLIWHDKDQHFLAKSLLALHDQTEELNKIVTASETLLRSGHSTSAHRKLISAINAYRNLQSPENSSYAVTVSDSELSAAIAQAGIMRESGSDQQHIAKTVLNLNYLAKHLESVYRAAERYLHSGMSASEQDKLDAAIKKYRAQEHRTSGEDINAFGVY